MSFPVVGKMVATRLSQKFVNILIHLHAARDECRGATVITSRETFVTARRRLRRRKNRVRFRDKHTATTRGSVDKEVGELAT